MYNEKEFVGQLYTELCYAIIPPLFSYFCHSAIPTSYYINFLKCFYYLFLSLFNTQVLLEVTVFNRTVYVHAYKIRKWRPK